MALAGELPDAANLAFHGLLFVTATVAIATENETFHHFFAYSSLIVISVYIALLFGHLD